MQVLLLCVVLPFVWLYVRDRGAGADGPRQRAVRGAKAGALGAAVLAGLLLVGAFVRTGAAGGAGSGAAWFAALEAAHTDAEVALGCVVGVLVLAALLLAGALAAYGLTALPLRVMLGGRRARVAAAAAAARAAALREQERALTARYAGGQRMGRADRAALAALRTERRVHEKRAARVASVHGDGDGYGGNGNSACGGGCCARLEPWVRPLRVAAGAVLLAGGALGVACAAVALADAQAHSTCGAACGYVVARPRWRSPADALLARLAPLFPLDAAAVAALALYATAAALVGLRDLVGEDSSSSSSSCWVHRLVPRLRAHGTAPEGVVALGVATALALLGATQGVLVLAPQYSAFGAQRGSAGGACTLADGACHAAQTAGARAAAVGVAHSALGVAQHYAAWLVAAAALALAPVAVHRARTRRVSYGTTLDGVDAFVNDGTALADSTDTAYGAVIV